MYRTTNEILQSIMHTTDKIQVNYVLSYNIYDIKFRETYSKNYKVPETTL